MNCLQCKKPLTRKRKKFCSNRCKDRYHNKHNPRGYYAYSRPTGDDYYDAEDEHPFSCEGLGQWVD